MATQIEKLCLQNGLKLTAQRRTILKVLSEAEDHPDVEELYKRTQQIDQKISMATLYRTLKLFEENKIIERHEFGDGRGRFEICGRQHHDHLIDIHTGKVIEFQNQTIEMLQKQVAEQLGYQLIDHRLELYGVPMNKNKRTSN